MAGPFFGIGLALLLAGLGRIALSQSHSALLSWALIALGAASMVAAIFMRRRTPKGVEEVRQKAIHQKTQGRQSPAIAQGSGTQHIHINYPGNPVQEGSVKILPKVMAVRYGRAPSGDREGLYLENDREAVFEVQPEPLIVGRGTVRFAVVNTLKKAAFSMATINFCEGHGSVQLDPVWRKAMEDQQGFGVEIPLRMIYRNYEGQWFRCVCRFERDLLVRGDSPFVVTTLRQEPMNDDGPAGSLCFGQTTFADFPPGMGNQAYVIEILNSERGYDRKYHGVKAELTFTHCHNKETLKRTGWLTALDTAKVTDWRAESVTLDSRMQNRIWLIVCVRSNVTRGTYWYSGPQFEYSPFMEGALLSHESQRFTFGKWEVKIAVTCDGDERLDREEYFQAE